MISTHHPYIVGLMQRLGEAGLAAAGRFPGLIAELDQHAAAIVDSLCPDGVPLAAVSLARYAEGVQDAAAARGWSAPDPAGVVDWNVAEWPLLRLLAVCHLARTANYA